MLGIGLKEKATFHILYPSYSKHKAECLQHGVSGHTTALSNALHGDSKEPPCDTTFSSLFNYYKNIKDHSW